jgi:hypothetical protein
MSHLNVSIDFSVASSLESGTDRCINQYRVFSEMGEFFTHYRSNAFLIWNIPSISIVSSSLTNISRHSLLARTIK